MIGQPARRVEDPRLLTHGGTYTDDIDVPGCLHLVFVRAPVAHARVNAVTAPGDVTVLTAADVDLPPLPPEAPTLNQDMRQPLLADEVIRYAGEPYAAVVAETRAAAEDAAARVDLDYTELPPILGPEVGDALVHPNAGTNVALKLTFARPAGRADIFAECPVVVRQHMVVPRVAACPLETRGGIASWEHGRLTYQAGGQAPHVWRARLATTLGIEEDAVRVVTPDVGGAFGTKALPGPEDVLVAWAARRLGLPVRWSESRTENLRVGGHGRAQWQEAELGGTPDGRVLAYRLSVVQDAGAYPRVGALLPFWTRTMLTGPYMIGKARFTSSSVTTTTAPVVSYRGAGQPEAVAALERMMDRFAAEIGMDPVEVRRRNLIPRDRFPWTALTRAKYDSGDYHAALDRALATADYEALRTEQRGRRAAGETWQLGIGLSTFAELTGADRRSEHATATVGADGRVTITVGTCDHGQGHPTSWTMLAADVLGVDMAAVEVRQGDTDALPDGGGTGGSRSLQTGGLAVREAALALVEEAAQQAAKVLGTDAVDFADGRFTDASGASLGWADLDGPLGASASYQPTDGTCASGTHLAVVEMDVETGRVRLRRLVAVDDAGVVCNPLIAEGQVHGGLAQGVGEALLEEVSFDRDGRPRHHGIGDYGLARATELPFFDTSFVQTPAPDNPLGVKGVGESGAVGAPAAVQNAVIDAVAHLGVTHIDMPATPERVWRAIRDAAAS